MSKSFDQQLLIILKHLGKNEYHRPFEVDIQYLETTTLSRIQDISHSLNNLQRDGLIRIAMGTEGKNTIIELLKTNQ